MEFIDSHCHLDYDYAPKSAGDLVREAHAAGITHLVTIGTEMPRLAEMVKISEAFPNVYHTVGIHPHEAKDVTDADIATLEAAARHPKCRAIGEIGLDYYYDHSPREPQIKSLNAQLDLALRVKLPIVVHARDAEADLLPALTRYAQAARASLGSRPPGAIHCFTGTEEFGLACIDLGFLISFSGILTFKNSEPLRAAARKFPLESLMVETDSPFLAPIPFRGKKCEPAMVRMTAEKLAEVKGVPVAEVARVTTANARRFFGLPEPSET